MSKIDNGGPAFPTSVAFDPGADFGNGMIVRGDKGMTLRDWFAGQALVGLLIKADEANSDGWSWRTGTLAGDAFLFADDMLAARAKGGVA